MSSGRKTKFLCGESEFPREIFGGIRVENTKQERTKTMELHGRIAQESTDGTLTFKLSRFERMLICDRLTREPSYTLGLVDRWLYDVANDHTVTVSIVVDTTAPHECIYCPAGAHPINEKCPR
jgi:hypothetical protein